ncbi:MAG TPA: S41 family peptidase [Deltaproteobacteria bacterium]|nr:S41 family peptidase [Deltaproteobacteria bacterium]
MYEQTPARATVLATGLFVAGLLVGSLTGRAAVARAQDPYAHLDLFARVLTTIEDDYVEPISPKELIDAAIVGMIGRLDGQSRWLDSDQLQELRDDAHGTTTSLGIEVEATEGGAEVVRVLDGSPAERDGLATGDQILEVDGQQLAGMPLETIRDRFEGDRGERATLKVLREGWEQPRTIETVRDRVQRRVVDGALLEQRVAYLRLRQFQEGTADDLIAELELLAGPQGLGSLQGLIVDVRDNRGGLLSEAVAVADLFLDEGVIVSTRGRNTPELGEIHRATPGGLPADLPTVLLINGMSASASEILAGALQDTGRGVLVGEPTYGKGTVQKVYLHDAPQETALKLTVGRYYTPSGQPVAPKEGRVPDHVVPYPVEAGPVAQLRARLARAELPEDEREELLTLVDQLGHDPHEHANIPWDLPIEQRLRVDPQLARALQLLR